MCLMGRTLPSLASTACPGPLWWSFGRQHAQHAFPAGSFLQIPGRVNDVAGVEMAVLAQRACLLGWRALSLHYCRMRQLCLQTKLCLFGAELGVTGSWREMSA